MVGVAATAEAILVRLGRTYGSTASERAMHLPGDDIVPAPVAVTNHGITIDASPDRVWPWLVQMGWGRGGWYTARWVDWLLFPANRSSADCVVAELQSLRQGDFVPDGPPETGCSFVVELIDPNRTLVLHSVSHLPVSWRTRAEVDWSWAFLLAPLDAGERTRFLLRSRWRTAPWWLTAAGLLGIVPADFVMSRGMLRGVKRRAEQVDTAPDGPGGRSLSTPAAIALEPVEACR